MKSFRLNKVLSFNFDLCILTTGLRSIIKNASVEDTFPAFSHSKSSEDQIKHLPKCISQEADWHFVCSASVLWQLLLVLNFLSLEVQGLQLCWNSITIK